MADGGTRIPNAERAVVAAEKVRDYVLSPDHPVGRFKAAFFQTLGYRQDNWQRLAADLREHATMEARPWPWSPYGSKYEVRAELTGPSGVTAVVVSVWIIRHGEGVPRFVTAYPGEGR